MKHTAAALGVLLAISVAGCSATDTAAEAPTSQAAASTSPSGVSKIVVPKVAGMTVAAATAALEAAGLTVTPSSDGTDVTGTSPGAGASVKAGSAVTLIIVDPAAKAREAAAEASASAAAAQASAHAAAAEAARIGTVSQQNAYKSAVSYLDFSHFSRAGLIDQLTSKYGDGFPAKDAEFAVARLEAEGGVDWNAEAVEAAKAYLEMTSFSRQGLIEQLTSKYGDRFTQKQAEYGVSAAGL